MSTITAGRCVAIRWMAWGPEALARAAKEDKLILVDSGATWCHWCHVMDRMTYEDEEVAALVNERFIPVRIDRDKLAEIDARLQRSPAIVDSQAGGWPLTAVLTPDGHILFKATFLPPRAGGEFGASVGLIDLLNRLDAAWRANRDKIADAGRQLAAAYAAQEAQVFGRAGDVSPALLQRIVTAIKAQYDPSHGGFGAAPKFYNAPAVETLLAAAWSGDRSAMEMAAHTLEMIARGGVHDQVGGGFHRYSVDERWHVPHFEKMAYDNAGLLAIYANASALAGRDDFAAVARRTIAWIDRTLLDPQRRGFYASQDADVGLDDDGDYFTWTLAEVRQAAGADADAAIYYYDVTSDGDMHGRPGRNVLHATKTIAQAARLLNRNEDDLAAAIERARLRMLQARDARTAPVVDKTIFADLNGMMIDAYLTAHERLGDTAARDTAIAVLDNLLTDLRDDRGVFAHWRSEGGPQRVGMLSDQAWMAKALVHAFALTSQGRYLDAAVKVCDHVLANLIAPDGAPLSTWHGHLAREWHGHPAREWHGHLAREWHGHLAREWHGRPARESREHPARADAGQDASAPPASPWELPLRGWDDSPSRSPATVIAEALIILGHLTGRDDFTKAGRDALASFAGSVRDTMATVLGGYALALDVHLNGPRMVVVAGDPAADTRAGADMRALADAARRAYIPGATILCLAPSSPPKSTDKSPDYAPELKAILDALGLQPSHALQAKAVAYICHGRACLAPAYSANELRERIAQLAGTM